MKFISGLKNCHIPGLYSLVLSERVSPAIGMCRVFYAGPDCDMGLWKDNGSEFRLLPHNHRQTIRLTRINGTSWNVKIDIGGNDCSGFRYAFTSALLNGTFGVKLLRKQTFSSKTDPITEAGITLRWSEYHTVVADPDSAWLVEEFECAPMSGLERCISMTPSLALSSDGLYLPMSAEELAEIAARLRTSTLDLAGT